MYILYICIFCTLCHVGRIGHVGHVVDVDHVIRGIARLAPALYSCRSHDVYMSWQHMPLLLGKGIDMSSGATRSRRATRIDLPRSVNGASNGTDTARNPRWYKNKSKLSKIDKICKIYKI